MSSVSPEASPSSPPLQSVSQRPDLSNKRLTVTSVVLLGLLVVYFLSLPALPEFMRKPGSPAIYLFGAAGSALLLVAAVFVFVKRTGRGGSPVNWFIAHVICSNIGFVLVAIHTTGKLDQMPALLLLNLVALMALGIWARLHASRAMADTFGNKLRGFSAGNDQRRAELKELIERKSNLLTKLDPDAHEATFSVTLAHYFRRPFIALAYQRLVQEEQQLIGARASVGWVQAWWRPLHLTLAATFVLGLLIHVVMVTFFAGYVADGGPVTWWHVSAWDF